MNACARPAELTETISPRRRIEEVRSLFCDCYEDCLDEALKLGWNSWTCVGCGLFTGPGAPRSSSAERKALKSRPATEHA